MELALAGHAALITGGSRGLGLAMASTFAAAGADVAILARRPDVLAEAKRSIETVAAGKVVAVACDVTGADEIEAAHAEVVDALGAVDILVNNAGTSRRMAFEDIADDVWHADLDLKLFAAIRLIRLALPEMKRRRWGRILNVLNIGAKAPQPASAPTSVSRAAGLALTKTLAGECAPYNVLVNALLVGEIVTDQIVRSHASAGEGVSFEDFVRARGAHVPLGRLGHAQEFANIACFLASDAASYVTGTAINVDGGLSPIA